MSGASPTGTGGAAHVVFGTGAVGLAVVDELVERGLRVTAVNRGGHVEVPAGVTLVGGDAADPVFAESVTRGAAVVYQCLNPPYTRWAELFPPLQRSVLRAAERAGARLVTLENLYMYRHDPTTPLTETTPEEPSTRKGRVRKAMSDELRHAGDEGRLEIAIGRASNYYGPRGGAMSPLGDRVVPRVLAGRDTSVLGDPELPHTYSYLPDIARGLVTLGERPEAVGRVWHLPTTETSSTSALVGHLYEAAGTEGRVTRIPRPALRVASWFNPLLRETMEMLYEYDEPFVVDASSFTETFGWSGTSVRTAAKATVEWYRTRG